MASSVAAAAKPKFTSFYRLAGMGYLDSLAVASTALRNVLREPARTESLARTNFVRALPQPCARPGRAAFPSAPLARLRARLTLPPTLTPAATPPPRPHPPPPPQHTHTPHARAQKYREFFYEDGKESLPNEFYSNPAMAKKK